ncbi:MAG: tripartite tricarboxylate transporter TctB family protein [Chloroflexi bacterium]|nr:tripartite tricarboxylate transporter TctB family protein [Chloroflexota bacterium]
MIELNRDRVLNLVVYAVLLLLVSSIVIGSNIYEGRQRLVPLVIGIPTMLLLIGIIVVELWPRLAQFNKAKGGGEDEPVPMATASGINAGSWQRVVTIFSWLIGFYVFTLIFGYYLSVPIFLAAFFNKEGEIALLRSIVIAIGVSVVLFLLFNLLLDIPLWPGVLPKIIPSILGGGSIPPLYRGL